MGKAKTTDDCAADQKPGERYGINTGDLENEEWTGARQIRSLPSDKDVLFVKIQDGLGSSVQLGSAGLSTTKKQKKKLGSADLFHSIP